MDCILLFFKNQTTTVLFIFAKYHSKQLKAWLVEYETKPILLQSVQGAKPRLKTAYLESHNRLWKHCNK